VWKTHLLEDVVDEGVKDAHRLGRDTGVRVDLLEHLVDVDFVGFVLAGLPLLGASGLDGHLLGGFLLSLGSHCCLFLSEVSECD
jgi:hypothetical protein